MNDHSTTFEAVTSSMLKILKRGIFLVQIVHWKAMHGNGIN